jgi:Mg/Co/Ni transporter MgtE
MIKLKKSESYLVDNNEKLLNKFELHQLLVEKNRRKKILKLYPSKFLKLYSETNIFESIEKSKDFVGESIPVVTKQNKICGVISEGDLFQIFLKITKEEKELENKD